jgi:uncharacterized protein DUF1707
VVAFSPITGAMLTSSAERDRAVDVLRAGFVEGRLTQGEFTERVAQVHVSRTYDQLSELISDLPAGPTAIGCAAEDLPADLPECHESMWRGASPAGLTLTSLIIFTLAALVTALALFLHAHPVQLAPSGGGQLPPHANLMPYIHPVLHPQPPR